LEQGNYEQAELHFRRALQISEKALGADHPDVAMSLNNLGNTLYQQGDYEQAELHHQRALQTRERVLGADHPDLARSLWGLADVALAQQQFDVGRAHAERGISILETHEALPDLLAVTRFVLAQALWPDRSQRARARIVAGQARDALADRGKHTAEELAEVEAWLRRVDSGEQDSEKK
jgi:tetratricopeptide (TPR) repeat protein